MVSRKKPLAFATDKNVRGLHDGLVETFGERGGDAGSAGDPADVAFNPNPKATERDADALGVLENPRPPLAHFVPAEQQFPSRLHAFDAIVVRPDRFHLR